MNGGFILTKGNPERGNGDGGERVFWGTANSRFPEISQIKYTQISQIELNIARLFTASKVLEPFCEICDQICEICGNGDCLYQEVLQTMFP